MTRPRLRIRRGTPRDRELLDGLLRGLSQDSAYRRFQTGLGAEPTSALLTALLPESDSGGAVLGFYGDTLVAHGLWARAGAAAEVAIVVADACQEQGVGTEIAQALMVELAARGVTEVEVFSAATNEAVARMVTRQAPDAVRDRDGATITYRFPTPPAALRVSRTGSPAMVSSGPRRRNSRKAAPMASSTTT
jgi:hypothetical protein